MGLASQTVTQNIKCAEVRTGRSFPSDFRQSQNKAPRLKINART
jgi:hypothetical protein